MSATVAVTALGDEPRPHVLPKIGRSAVDRCLLAVHFALSGVSQTEATLFVARPHEPKPLLESVSALAVPLAPSRNEGPIELVLVCRELSRADVRLSRVRASLVGMAEARGVQTFHFRVPTGGIQFELGVRPPASSGEEAQS